MLAPIRARAFRLCADTTVGAYAYLSLCAFTRPQKETVFSEYMATVMKEEDLYVRDTCLNVSLQYARDVYDLVRGRLVPALMDALKQGMARSKWIPKDHFSCGAGTWAFGGNPL